MRRPKTYEDNYVLSTVTRKINTFKGAQEYGRVAASLEWGLGELADEVEPQFQDAARGAYERRMKQLHGAPF